MLVVEDQAALRMLLCDLLERHGFETAAAPDAAAATALFAEFDPDALLTDIDLGTRPSGAELAVMLAALAPHLAVVFLSSYPRAAAGTSAMGIPRAVFVSKQDLDSPGALLAALEDALSTRPAPSPPVPPASPAPGSAASPAPRSAASSAPEPPSPDPLAALTRHQLDILAMIARGWSNERIAEETGGTVRAVERSISRLFDRLRVGGDPTVNPRVAAAATYLAAFGPVR